MKMMNRGHPGIRLKQKGVTLIELLVAGVISLIAASGMVLVMASTLGTGSQTIQMARLTQEMRTGMQIMSRELKRANYHSTYLSCYGKVDCLVTLGLTNEVGTIGITDNGDSDCFWFWYDRLQSCSSPSPPCTPAQLEADQEPVTDEPVAAFRRTVVDGTTIGKLQMTTEVEDSDCAADEDDEDWVDITDPNIIDVLTFNVSDAASYIEIFNADNDFQSVEKIALSMTAKLTVDPSVRSWIQTNTNASRELTEFVSVRNNITIKFVAPTP